MKNFYIEFILDAKAKLTNDSEILSQTIRRLEVFENGEIIEGDLVDKLESESQKSLRRLQVAENYMKKRKGGAGMNGDSP